MLNKPLRTVGGVDIYGNNHLRPFLEFRDLTPKEQKELDWVKDDYATVLRYKGDVYALDEFMRVKPNAPAFMQGYHGYTNDSAFSGLLIKLDEEEPGEYYQIYTWIS